MIPNRKWKWLAVSLLIVVGVAAVGLLWPVRDPRESPSAGAAVEALRSIDEAAKPTTHTPGRTNLVVTNDVPRK